MQLIGQKTQNKLHLYTRKRFCRGLGIRCRYSHISEILKERLRGSVTIPISHPTGLFKNNVSCKQFGELVRTTLLTRLKSGAISLVGKVGQVSPHHIVLLLTVEPTKPRLS